MEASHKEALRVGALEIRPDEYVAYCSGRIVAREELYRAAWGGRLRAQDRSVDVYIHKLRAKLGRALPGWRYIHTHFGFGYRLSPELSQPFHETATPS